MSRVVIARDGDMVDEIALEAYGRTAGTTEALLDANPHLAGLPARLTAGVAVTLPELQTATKPATVRLWD